MSSDFTRIAIVNRGEPAIRLIHAVREYNREHGTQLSTIAFYTDPDRQAFFVREADEAYALGSATFVDESDGERKSRYLDYATLERALAATRAEAVWVGWGFVAEHAAFADLCDEMDITFIGPSGDVMRQLGDKITSKQIAEEANVPVAPWSGGAVDTIEAARTHAERLGYPLMVKATAGGGGRGIRKVHDETQLEDTYTSARSEALKAFGDASVFLERLVTGARHIEVQIIGDGTTCWAVGVRDCTLQRRHQKVLEETPSPALTPKQDHQIRAAAARLGETVGYQNAGTVEFLYEPETETFSFMEVNTRLQVEHPVTELVTGLDLVKTQIHVARGGTLDGDPPADSGHAIELRLNAEDPELTFAPAPGTLALFRAPTGPGLRLDSGFEEGDEIPSEFDSMIAKLIAYGRTREEAMARLKRALTESAIVIRGGMSNKGFLLELLDHPDVQAGEYDVAWLDRHVAAGKHLTSRHAEIALIEAALEVYEDEKTIERNQFLASASRGRPEVSDTLGIDVELECQGVSYTLNVNRVSPDRYQITVDGRRIHVDVEERGPNERQLTVGDQNYRIFSVVQGVTHLIEVNGVPHRISEDQGGAIRAPAPAVVVSIDVKEGDHVEVGDRLAVLEAMKMEMPVVAEVAGTVRDVQVRNNTQVPTGTPLLVIEATDDERPIPSGVQRLTFAGLGLTPDQQHSARAVCKRNLDEVKSLMLGFDVDPGQLQHTLSEEGMFCEGLPPDDTLMLASEDEILNIFTDISSLFRRQRTDDDLGDEARHSTEEYLFTYLRDLDAKGKQLPPTFIEKLKHVLAYYGVTGLERTKQLEESLFRIAKSHQQMHQQVMPVLSILERRLEHCDAIRDHVDADFQHLLGRLITVTQGLFPSVNDLAREVRYQYFNQPLLDQARQQAYDEAETHLKALADDPERDDRLEHIHALVACPQPLKSVLSSRFEAAPPPVAVLMLEVMMRRYYRIRDLENVQTVTLDGQNIITAEYDHEGDRIHVVTAHTPYDALAETAERVGPFVADYPEDHDVVVDFYVWKDGPLSDPDETTEHLDRILDDSALPSQLRRIVVALSGPESGRHIGGTQHFTFRPSDDGYWEEKFYKGVLHRGLHPMMAKRLHLYRLENFDIERLPSAEDVYLLRATAKTNPKDERLIGVAEVRDVTPVRNDSGRVVQLPYLERMLMEVLSGFRKIQAQRSRRQRLHWNRILLYVWPPLSLRSDEFNEIARKLAPATEGVGLEAVVVHARLQHPKTGALRESVITLSNVGDGGMMATFDEPTAEPIEPLTEYEQQVLRVKRRGLVYPYELIKMLTPEDDNAPSGLPRGSFQEYDLDEDKNLVPVDRPYGQNASNVVVGTIKNYTAKYPEGMERVILLGDPSRGMGNLAEDECRLINAAMALAQEKDIPVEWFAVSAGARIAMDSGTENMDWIALTLRRIVEFTQAGGEMNIIIVGINVGAQPYWNAEATMLMHTRGVLIMTDDAAMVLTGKKALDYSGGVSAEDNFGIGGYERIMGPNGQAQYGARDVTDACHILLRYYDHTYVMPDERWPRRAATSDPADRDVCVYPHGRIDGMHLDTVGDIFSDEANPGRKLPFDIRKVMRAVTDQDQDPLERWYAMRDAEIGVVWDAHLGGYPVCMLGLESRPVPRMGYVPADGPSQWTGGTLFPRSSKKIARAINAATNNRPVVVLANLSGFDGSPESMRKWQLEYGAEIGRAVVNFEGPIVFCVVSRYHGGAFVVFSNKLNENVEIAALEGTYASVIGGAPAAAVVFAREVRKRTNNDARLKTLNEEIDQADGAEKVRLRARYNELYEDIYSENLGAVATEYDNVHSVHRAKRVGSVHHIIEPTRLRPYLIDAVERGMQKTSLAPGEVSTAAS